MQRRLSLTFSVGLFGMALLPGPAASQSTPAKMAECEGTRCDGVWTFDGQAGTATWASGARANLEIERFDAEAVRGLP
jgi:hypothetical protein